MIQVVNSACHNNSLFSRHYGYATFRLSRRARNFMREFVQHHRSTQRARDDYFLFLLSGVYSLAV